MLVGAGGGLGRLLQRQSRNRYDVCFFIALVAVAALDLPVISFDSPQYIALAEGRFESVVAPFSAAYWRRT